MDSTKSSIVIVGYGKMGKAIENLVPESQLGIDGSCSINKNIIDPIIGSGAKFATISDFIQYIKRCSLDYKSSNYVAIDFSAPAEVVKNIELYAQYKINSVIGTTGWYDSFHYVEKLVNKSGIGLVYSTNFSDSVQMAFVTNIILAAMANSMRNWDVSINEVHHNKKLDISGTATTFAKDIIKNNLLGKTAIASSVNGGKKDSDITISSDRLNGVFGEHKIQYAHESGDRIDLFHHADSRDGFASGAIKAAEFIRSRSGLYNYADVVRERFLNAISRQLNIGER